MRRVWGELDLGAAFYCPSEIFPLPFADGVFDLAWQWAGLWYLADAEALLAELCRVSSRLVFVSLRSIPDRISSLKPGNGFLVEFQLLTERTSLVRTRSLPLLEPMEPSISPSPASTKAPEVPTCTRWTSAPK